VNQSQWGDGWEGSHGGTYQMSSESVKQLAKNAQCVAGPFTENESGCVFGSDSRVKKGCLTLRAQPWTLPVGLEQSHPGWPMPSPCLLGHDGEAAIR
jgi:hypothetical protein